MPTIRERAAAVFGRWAQDAGGWESSYSDTDGTCTITATPAKREYELNVDGMPTKFVMYDFIVVKAELVTSGGQVITPKQGGLITVVRDGVTSKYQLSIPLGLKLPCVEDMDASGRLLLFHTTKVKY